MLLGELPVLRDTQSGKDLIQIGKKEALVIQLETKFETLTSDIRQRIEEMNSTDKLDELLVQVLEIKSIDQLNL